MIAFNMCAENTTRTCFPLMSKTGQSTVVRPQSKIASKILAIKILVNAAFHVSTSAK